MGTDTSNTSNGSDQEASTVPTKGTMQIRKVLVAGSVGVGKTTAVRAASVAPILTTEAAPTDAIKLQKNSTTVAMDFSVIWLDDTLKVHLYGTPGQERFDFMWDVLAEGTAGVILLADDSSPDVFGEMQAYLDAFQHLIDKRRLVLGVTRLENDRDQSLQMYRDFFAEKKMSVPVLEADPRSRHDIIVLIRASLATAHLDQQI